MPGALDGVRILDMTRVLAGPYATMILGDLGADVIKVEAPGGSDDTRFWGPPFQNGMSAYYTAVNRNKRSITVNLKEENGKQSSAALPKQRMSSFTILKRERWKSSGLAMMNYPR